MRKLILIFIVCLVFITSGCLTSAPTGTAAVATPSKYDATQDARIVSLEGIVLGPNGLQALVGALNTKITGIADTSGLSSRLSSVESKVSIVEGKVGSSSTPAVTQATVDALSARIKTLEDWKAGVGTGSTSTPTGTISGNSILLSSDQDIEMWLEWVDPNKNLNEYESRFNNEVEFQFAIKNKSLESTRKYAIEMRLTPEEDTVLASATVPTYISTSMGTWTMSRSPNTLQNPVTLNSPTGTTAGRISRNSVDKYNFRLQLAQTPSVYWKVRFYIEQIDD